ALPARVSPIFSMVAIFLPATVETGVTQLRAGLPSMCTVHAPHNAMPQPNLVPVMSRWSRSTQSSGVSPSASACTSVPLTSSEIIRVSGDRYRSATDQPLQVFRVSGALKRDRRERAVDGAKL